MRRFISTVGWRRRREFIQQQVLGSLDQLEELGPAALLNYKSLVQEQAQTLGWPLPRYSIIAASGPEHAKLFTVEAKIGDRFATRATASSKKAASQLAAETLYEMLSADTGIAAGLRLRSRFCRLQ